MDIVNSRPMWAKKTLSPKQTNKETKINVEKAPDMESEMCASDNISRTNKHPEK